MPIDEEETYSCDSCGRDLPKDQVHNYETYMGDTSQCDDCVDEWRHE